MCQHLKNRLKQHRYLRSQFILLKPHAENYSRNLAYANIFLSFSYFLNVMPIIVIEKVPQLSYYTIIVFSCAR